MNEFGAGILGGDETCQHRAQHILSPIPRCMGM